MPRSSVVLDTNVVVSALIHAAGWEGRVMDLALRVELEWHLSPDIFAEYERVLRRPKFGYTSERLDLFLENVKRQTVWHHPTHILNVSPDPSDNRFLECAEASRADYLVTGNKRDFPARWRETRIVNAAELVTILFPNIQGPSS